MADMVLRGGKVFDRFVDAVIVDVVACRFCAQDEVIADILLRCNQDRHLMIAKIPSSSPACRAGRRLATLADNNRDKLFMPFGYGARDRAIDAARKSRLDRRLPADIPGRLPTRSGLEQLESGAGASENWRTISDT
jgi:hypothetical protein